MLPIYTFGNIYVASLLIAVFVAITTRSDRSLVQSVVSATSINLCFTSLAMSLLLPYGIAPLASQIETLIGLLISVATIGVGIILGWLLVWHKLPATEKPASGPNPPLFESKD